MYLKDKYATALVTGAGSGLGAAFADMLLRAGVEVWGTSRDSARLAGRDGLHPLRLELGDAASVEAAWAQAEAESGGIDLLVNNAGHGVFGPFADLPAALWEQQVAVLLLGPVRLARLAWGRMVGRGRGGIVNVASLAVEFPLPFQSAYNAGKAALSALSASLELESAGTGIRVIDFRPGDYRTDFNRAMAAQFPLPSASPAAARVWARIEALLAAAPTPERAARDLERALQRGRTGVVRSGSWFQAGLAPLLSRCGSSRLRMAVLRRYFDLD